jgi:hypothetical protein
LIYTHTHTYIHRIFIHSITFTIFHTLNHHSQSRSLYFSLPITFPFPSKMHSWLENIVNLYRNMRNNNFALFDEDPLGRSINLQSHCYGEFSSAVVQANTAMEDQSQIEVASDNALFLGIYDGHGGIEASRFICEHLFKNLLSEYLSLIKKFVSFY